MELVGAKPYVLFDNLFLTPEEFANAKLDNGIIQKEFFKEPKEYFESNLGQFYTLESRWKFLTQLFELSIIGSFSEDIYTFLRNLPVAGLLNPKLGIEIVSFSCSYYNQIHLDMFLSLTPDKIPEELIAYLKIEKPTYIPKEPIRILARFMGYLKMVE